MNSYDWSCGCSPSSCKLAMIGGLCCGGCCSVSMSEAKQEVVATFG